MTIIKFNLHLQIRFKLRVRKLGGILKVDSDFDYKKILDEERSKKYGI
jgi:hypothetical protein